MITEEQYLSNEEKNILRNLRDKKLFFILGTYGALVWVLIEAWFKVGLNEVHWRYANSRAIACLVFMILCFIGLTIYFTRYYFKSVHPLIKDIKAGTKQVLFFTPGRYQTPFFAEYYLKTPFENSSLIKIDKEFYDTIHDGSKGCICSCANSKFVFSVDIDGRKMKFNYSTLIDDL